MVQSQGICDPDSNPPALVECPRNIIVKLPDNTCTMSVDWFAPFVEGDDCDTTNAISSVDFFTDLFGQGSGNNGQFILHGSDSFTVIGTTNGTPGDGNNNFRVCFYSTCNGKLDFKWRAQMSGGDGFINDRTRLKLTHAVHEANVNVDLTPNDDSYAEGIVLATQILAGDRFCIEVQSDNTDGVNSTTIRDLVFVQDPIDVVQTLGPNSGDFLPQGLYPVEYIATDCGGNTSYCNFNIEVLPPDSIDLLVCPTDVTIQLPHPAMCDSLLSSLIPTGVNCGPVTGFTEEMNPFIKGVMLIEAAEPGMGDGVIGTDGLVYVNPARDSLILWGINNGTIGNSRNDTSVIQVCLMPRCPGTVSFDWSASTGFMFDFARDEAGIKFNGKDSILSMPLSADYALGNVSLQLDGINPLCFYVRSTNVQTENIFTIYNFVYQPDGPQIVQTSGPDINLPVETGVHEFTFEARDCYGNIDSCSFEVTILGNQRSSMACKNLNISLNENCESVITPDMLVSGICTSSLIVELTHYGKPVPNPIDSHYLWQHIVATVTDTMTGNICWSDLYIEDKLAPVIICKADTTDCYSFEFDFPLNYNGKDCSNYTVTTVDQRIEHFHCDENFLKAIYRDILITDEKGNTDQCTDTIFVTRFRAADISLPNKQSLMDCSYPFTPDANGLPSPLQTGLPTVVLHDGTVHNIWPLNSLLDCNIFIQYEDIDLGEINCVRKIMRTWKVREWWCGTEIVRSDIQLIIISDQFGPQITHAPYGFNATTERLSCKARVLLPSIEAFDYCHNKLRIDISYPGGILINQNGGYVDLPAGDNSIVYRVYDECYNVTEHEIRINVADGTQPVAVCKRNTVVALNQAGYNWVPASVLDNGSFDECAIHHFEIRRMDQNYCGGRGEDDWGPESVFCCEDVGKTIMTGLKVVDHSGNEAICMVNVEVQDKNRPSISCLPDITIDCRFDIDYNHLEVFGKIVTDTADREKIVLDPGYNPIIGGHPLDGIAKDNCPPTILETIDTSQLNQCGIGYIIRTFQARDQQGNLSDICTQTITIVNNDVFNENDIFWPYDYETSGICNPAELIPERLHQAYSRPIVNDDECSLVSISYKDEVFSATLPGDPCFKIFRTWSVLDWCQRDLNGDLIVWSHTQILKVNNFVAPRIIRVTQDTVVCSYELNCNPIPVSFSIEAEDDCTDSTQMLYSCKIDLQGDGTIDIIKSSIGGNKVEGIWPIGRHIVKWEVEDRCGNTAKAQFILDLQNCKSPVAYCLNGLSTNLTPMDTTGDGIPDAAMDTIWAKDFDAGSYHNCGYKIDLSFSSDIRDNYRVYTCDSIGHRTVELWVTDVNGNTSFCRTFIDVQDNSRFCPPSLKNSNVDGLVATERQDRVQNVSMNLVNSGLQSVMTDGQGLYSFSQIPNGQVLTLKPEKNDGWINGVTTADIVKIQRHILGLEPLNSAYKMIAADVNKSQTITAKDISDIRRLILGVTSEISGNTSWRFVNQLYSFNDIANTLTQNFPETYEINPLMNNMNLNFYAIKTGDVNESAVTKGFSENIARNRKTLELEINELSLVENESAELILKAINGSEFYGMQFTLQWDINKMELEGLVGNELLNINEDNFSVFRVREGKLSFSWNGDMSETNWLLKLKFKAVKNLKISESIAINSTVTPALSVPRSMDEDARVILSFKGSLEDDFRVLQNEPNPWSQTTVIGMILPQAGEVSITIYDVSGKVFLRDKLRLNKGYQEYQLNHNQLPQSGVYYYQVDHQTNSETRKMVILR